MKYICRFLYLSMICFVLSFFVVSCKLTDNKSGENCDDNCTIDTGKISGSGTGSTGTGTGNTGTDTGSRTGETGNTGSNTGNTDSGANSGTSSQDSYNYMYEIKSDDELNNKVFGDDSGVVLVDYYRGICGNCAFYSNAIDEIIENNTFSDVKFYRCNAFGTAVKTESGFTSLKTNILKDYPSLEKYLEWVKTKTTDQSDLNDATAYYNAYTGTYQDYLKYEKSSWDERGSDVAYLWILPQDQKYIGCQKANEASTSNYTPIIAVYKNGVLKGSKSGEDITSINFSQTVNMLTELIRSARK